MQNMFSFIGLLWALVQKRPIISRSLLIEATPIQKIARELTFENTFCQNDGGMSWEPEACEHALLPHSYIDGDGLTSGVRSLCAEDDELDDALRSAGVF